MVPMPAVSLEGALRSLASCKGSGLLILRVFSSLDGCCQAPRDGFMAPREKIYSDPLLVDIKRHTNTKSYEFIELEL